MEIVFEGLWRLEEDSFGVIDSAAFGDGEVASHFKDILRVDLLELLETFNLLIHEGASWREEKDLPSRKPEIEIQHRRRCDERFAEAGRQSDQCVVAQACLHDAELILTETFSQCVILKMKRKESKELVSWLMKYISESNKWSERKIVHRNM